MFRHIYRREDVQLVRLYTVFGRENNEIPCDGNPLACSQLASVKQSMRSSGGNKTPVNPRVRSRLHRVQERSYARTTIVAVLMVVTVMRRLQRIRQRLPEVCALVHWYSRVSSAVRAAQHVHSPPWRNVNGCHLSWPPSLRSFPSCGVNVQLQLSTSQWNSHFSGVQKNPDLAAPFLSRIKSQERESALTFRACPLI